MVSRPASTASRYVAILRLLILLVGCLSMLACHQAPSSEETALEIVAFEGRTMGTYYAVKVVGTWSEEDKGRFQQAVEEELDDVNQRMSTYLEESELSRFNRHPAETPFEVSASLQQVMQSALDIGRVSSGAYDITIGPLAEAWGFGPGGDKVEGEVSEEAIESLQASIGNEFLSLDTEVSTLTKSQAALRCDLSSIAKGFAVDRVAERLTSLGATDHWVEVGGEVRAAGLSGSGRVWRLGIERPQLMPGAVQRLLPLADASVATSGDYRNYREIDGERFSHIIDPRTGRPIQHRLASVSVVHPQCMMADGWATALMVMGLDEGFRLAVEQDLAVLFLAREGDDFIERSTPAFDRLTATR